ncbi:hypothetical protein BGX24_012147 [Mortierella sp. AD032]|nr:hypothetical protein BGX24_012147 [Mortierella sp. AD032]
MPLGGMAGHHGGTPAGSFGTSGLNTIPEVGNGSIGGNGNGTGSIYDQGYHRSPSHQSGAAKGPPKTKPNFFRMNKKRFSVNTALLQKQTMNSVELTARTASSTNLSGLWNSNNSNSSVPNSINNPEQSSATGSWKQGWIPEEEADEVPMPSLLSTSRSYNTVINSSGQSPLLTPMARYKLQHQEGSSSAPSSTVNLGAALLQNQIHNSGFASSSGFVTSADEREEWSADGGDGDDEGEGYLDRRPSSYSTTNSLDQQGFQHYQQNQQQYSNQPFRSASAVPFSSSSPRSHRSHHHNQQQQTQQQQQSTPTVHTIGSRYKQRSTGLLSGINFDTGGGAMTSIDAGQESAGEAGYQSGSSTGHGPSISSGRFGPSSAGPGGIRSGSPMIINLQQASTSTSSLVQGRHNVSEQDQQLVSRGSSENMRRGSMGTAMSP